MFGDPGLAVLGTYGPQSASESRTSSAIFPLKPSPVSLVSVVVGACWQAANAVSMPIASAVVVFNGFMGGIRRVKVP